MWLQRDPVIIITTIMKPQHFCVFLGFVSSAACVQFCRRPERQTESQGSLSGDTLKSACFRRCRVTAGTAEQNGKQYCLWAAIWWVSLCASLRGVFLRQSHFPKRWSPRLVAFGAHQPRHSPLRSPGGPERRAKHTRTSEGATCATWCSRALLSLPTLPRSSRPAPCLQMWLNLLRLC